MPIDLAQRLIYTHAAPRGDIEAALFRSTREHLPFLSALIELRPNLRETVEFELARASGGEARVSEPDLDLVARLPDGLCSQFLGFPIAGASSDGAVDVLIADPMDTHAKDEFGFHLQAPIELVRGPLSFLTARLVQLEGRLAPLTALQALRPANEAPLASRQADSAPPIPLLRLAPRQASAPPRTVAPKTRPGVAPPAQEVTVIPETRGAGAEPASSAAEALEASSSESSFQFALSELAVAEAPEQVVEAMVHGLSSTCEEVVILAVRGTVLRSRCRADRSGKPEKSTSAELPVTAPSCAASALQSGEFLGAPVEADRLIFQRPAAEVAARLVQVAEKPALVVCISGFARASQPTRRADHLARAASDALSRIVLSRKH